MKSWILTDHRVNTWKMATYAAADADALKAVDDEYPFTGMTDRDAKELYNAHFKAFNNIDAYKAIQAERNKLRDAVRTKFGADAPKSPGLGVIYVKGDTSALVDVTKPEIDSVLAELARALFNYCLACGPAHKGSPPVPAGDFKRGNSRRYVWNLS
jgi:hypothetical protein